ncbi:Nephrocystin-3 [Paramyrothecium foliicola]|nr:Nephrocystin-3 [Paramyrothecium foliicola]
MSHNEAHQLLLKLLHDDQVSSKATLALSSRLESLPLALAQAAAFIHENFITIEDYIQLLDESDDSLVERLTEPFVTVGRDSETPYAVTATWIISFQQIEKQDTLACEILALLSFFDRHAIPRQLVECFYGKVQNQKGMARLIKAMGTLKSFSFITEGPDRTLDIHRLVQLVIKKWLVEKGTDKVMKAAVCALLSVAHCYPICNYETQQDCIKYLPHAHAVLRSPTNRLQVAIEMESGLRYRLGKYFLFEERWNEGEENFNLALDLCKPLYKVDHPHMRKCMTALASTYRNQGRYEHAQNLQLRLLKIYTTTFGESHSETLINMRALARTYLSWGRLGEAEEIQTKAMELCKRNLGESHLDTLSYMDNLAVTYQRQGRWDEAEKLQTRIVQTSQRRLGEEHRETMTSMANLAKTYRYQGRWSEAEKIQVKLFDFYRVKFGEERPETITSMRNLATTYLNQGRLAEAERLRSQAVKFCKTKFGDFHLDTWFSRAELATVYRMQGRFQESEELGSQVAEFLQQRLGADHRDTLLALGNLASTYRERGRLDEAERMGVQVMEAFKKTFGESHHSTLTYMFDLALTYKEQGRSGDAIALMHECVARRRRTLGESHEHTLESLDILNKWQKC